MSLIFTWPWVTATALIIMAIIITVVWFFTGRSAPRGSVARVFSLDTDLNTELASTRFRQWRAINAVAMTLLCLAVIVSSLLAGRPAQVAQDDEQANSRDIVLCLDVSGSTLPYDREIINTYLDLVNHFSGERIGMSIFNSTSRIVFPLTDDYALVTTQLTTASTILKGVESQDDIDKMNDEQYQQISDWLDGTQNRKDATSLIGDGVVSCAAMIPGFAYGSAEPASDRQRPASIVLATDNVVSGTPTYTLEQALDLTATANIDVDGLYSGPKESRSDETTHSMQTAIEAHHGIFMTTDSGTSIDSLVRTIEQRQHSSSTLHSQAAYTDSPGWWTLALVIVVACWLLLAWRLRR